MKRILRTIPSYFPYVTGPANQARAISERLAPLGYESSIVTTTLGAPAAPRREKIGPTEVTRLPIQFGFMQYHVAVGAVRESLTKPADIVHIHSYRNFLADAAATAARIRRIPFVLHLHGSLSGYTHMVDGRHSLPYRAYDAVTRPLPTLKADRIIVSTSQEAREVQEAGINADRISVIPMGIDPDQYQFEDVQRDPRLILFVGRLAQDRNVEQLLESLAKISDIPWRCRIVGGEERRTYANRPGYVAQLQKLALELGIGTRVEFTGPLVGEALRRSYAEAGVFVYTSHYENFGQTVLEAASAGCAIVSTPVGVAPEIIDDGQTGFLVNKDDAHELSLRLRILLDSPQSQEYLGTQARRRSAQRYSWDRITASYMDLYEELLETKSKANQHVTKRKAL